MNIRQKLDALGIEGVDHDQRIHAALDGMRQSRQLLASIEWAHRSPSGEPACPKCIHPYSMGHASACELATVLHDADVTPPR